MNRFANFGIAAIFLISVFLVWIGKNSQHSSVISQSPPQISEVINGGNVKIQNFSEAKQHLWKIYGERGVTFYCGCQFHQKFIDHESCQYIPVNKHNERAYRVEWEHIVPAENFGRSFAAWREGHHECVSKNGKPYRGRKCAQKVSKTFRLMEADLYNLVPSVGEVNHVRGSKGVGIVAKGLYQFGNCSVEIDETTIEPPDVVKGFVARTYKYMDHTYPGHGIISRKNKKLFDSWDKMYPPSADEQLRAAKIAKIQGNINIFVMGQNQSSNSINTKHSN